MKEKPKEFNHLLFADGASRGNPGPGGWGVILVTKNGEVREKGGKDPETTNNRMELTAVIEGVKAAANLKSELSVFTDSTYVIRGITQWCWAWMKRGWKTSEDKDVANADLWQKLIKLVAARGKGEISWHYVRGHAGIPGNERVDEIATQMADGKWVELYSGPLLNYTVAIHDLPESTELPEMKPIGEPKAKAHSYLSVVNGVAKRHHTWAECEARVKGRSGAKFKKAMSPTEEAEILASWGLSEDSLS